MMDDEGYGPPSEYEELLDRFFLALDTKKMGEAAAVLRELGSLEGSALLLLADYFDPDGDPVQAPGKLDLTYRNKGRPKDPFAARARRYTRGMMIAKAYREEGKVSLAIEVVAKRLGLSASLLKKDWSHVRRHFPSVGKGS